MEFLKTNCKTKKKQCDFCDSWTTIPMKQIPHQCSDVQRPRHFVNVSINVSMTPSHTFIRWYTDISRRFVAKGKSFKAFNCNELLLKDRDKMADFSANI